MSTLITSAILINYLCYFILGIAGAFSKDIYDTLTGDCRNIRIKRIVLGGILSAVFMPMLESLVFASFGVQTLLAIGFLLGVMSFELFGKISSIAGIKDIAKDAVEIKSILKERKIATTEKENEVSASVENEVITADEEMQGRDD